MNNYNRYIGTAKYLIWGNKKDQKIKIIDRSTKQLFLLDIYIGVLMSNFTNDIDKYLDYQLYSKK